MDEIAIGTVPVSLQVALGMGDYAFRRVRMQFRGPAPVYWTESMQAPDLASVQGWRHAAGDVLTRNLYGSNELQAWCWTTDGTATVVIQDAH